MMDQSLKQELDSSRHWGVVWCWQEDPHYKSRQNYRPVPCISPGRLLSTNEHTKRLLAPLAGQARRGKMRHLRKSDATFL